jgi:hypothetical protein
MGARQPCDYHAQRSSAAGGLFWRYQEARLAQDKQQETAVQLPASDELADTPQQDQEHAQDVQQQQQQWRGKKKKKKKSQAAVAAAAESSSSPVREENEAVVCEPPDGGASRTRSSDTEEAAVLLLADQRLGQQQEEGDDHLRQLEESLPVALQQDQPPAATAAAAAAIAPLQQQQGYRGALPLLLQLQEQRLQERQVSQVSSAAACQPSWKRLLQQLQAHVAGSNPASPADAASYVSRTMSLAVDAWEELNKAAGNHTDHDSSAGDDSVATAAAAASSDADADAAERNRADKRSSSRKAAGPQHAAEQLFALQHCVVCLDAPRSVVLMPCKHAVLCQGCSQLMLQQARREVAGGLSRCPMCREQVHQHLSGIILP